MPQNTLSVANSSNQTTESSYGWDRYSTQTSSMLNDRVETLVGNEPVSVTEGTSYSTGDYNTGEYVSGFVYGLDEAYDGYYYSQAVKYAKGPNKASNSIVKNYNNLFTPKTGTQILDDLSPKNFLKGKGNLIALTVGIGIETINDVGKLQAQGADNKLIGSQVATNIIYGVANFAVSTAVYAATTAVIAGGCVVAGVSAPVIGVAAVGTAAAITASVAFDKITSSDKVKTRYSLYNMFK